MRFFTVPRIRSVCWQLCRKNCSKLSFELNILEETNAIYDKFRVNRESRILTELGLLEAPVEHVVA